MSTSHDVPSLDPDRTLDIVLESIAELVDYELAVVLGYDSNGGLKVRKGKGPLYSKRLEGYIIPEEVRKSLDEVIEGREPHLFADSEPHLDTYHGVLDLPEGHSCLVAPLYVQDRGIGLLTLDHRVCGKFTPGIVRFIGAMARLISMAVANSDRNRLLAEANRSLAGERNQLLSRGSSAFEGLEGSSPQWVRVLDAIRLAASSELPVLIMGETGTGKEGVARALHRLSPRASGPFVAVNCSALSEGLVESELFGHEKGSFTGAAGRRRGRFELAHGGSIFLDEIGDLPLALQPKILRAIQEGRFERVGGEACVEVDVRVIAATHVDLPLAVRQGRFRADLYYRLDAFPISLPPLREREGDVLVLARYFLERIKARPGFGDLALSPGALAAMEAHSWPGNVRELEHGIERAAVLAGKGLIEASHIFARPGEAAFNKDAAGLERAIEARGAARSIRRWDEAGRALIEEALAASGGRIYGKGGAAELLGLKPSTLQAKMARLGLRR